MVLVSTKYKKRLEARVGIEPTHKGFADLSLTTWVPRLDTSTVALSYVKIHRCRQSWREPATTCQIPLHPILSESATRLLRV